MVILWPLLNSTSNVLGAAKKVLGMMIVLMIGPVPFATALQRFKRKYWPLPLINYAKKRKLVL